MPTVAGTAAHGAHPPGLDRGGQAASGREPVQDSAVPGATTEPGGERVGHPWTAAVGSSALPQSSPRPGRRPQAKVNAADKIPCRERIPGALRRIRFPVLAAG